MPQARSPPRKNAGPNQARQVLNVSEARLSAHKVKRIALSAMDGALRERAIAKVGLVLVAGPTAREAERLAIFGYAARDRTGGHSLVATATVDIFTGEASAEVLAHG